MTARGGVARPAGPPRLDLRLRLLATAAFFGGLVALGVGQRWWIAYLDRPAAAAAATAVPAAPDDGQQRLQQQIASYRERLRALTPEERGLYKDFVDQFSAQVVANPGILDLSHPVWNGSGRAVPDLRARVTQAAMAAWLALTWLVERAGAVFAWLCVLLGAVALGAFLLQQPPLWRRACDGSVLATRLWLWSLSLLCAGVFAASGRDVWLDIPWYAWSPSFALLAALLLTDNSPETQPFWERAADVCLAPALSFTLLWAGSLLLAATIR